MNIETGKAASWHAQKGGKLVPNPKAKLKDQFHEVARFKYLSGRTEATYWQWTVRFLKFYRNKDLTSPRPSPLLAGAEREKGWRHPKEMGAKEVREYLTHWAARENHSKRRVSSFVRTTG